MEPAHPFLGKRVAWIGAHPDDESFTAGGTLRAIVESGGSVSLLVATRGERGRAHVGHELSDDALTDLRHRELLAAANAIGAEHVSALDLPDGALAEHADGLEGAIAAHVVGWGSDVVMSFGADGYTGHRDHCAVGSAARAVARMLRLAYAAVALPAEERDSFAAHLSGKRRHGAYEDHPHHGDAIRIAVDPAFKMRLLQLYGTQFDGLDPYAVFPKDLAEHFLHNEYFVMHAAD